MTTHLIAITNTAV